MSPAEGWGGGEGFTIAMCKGLGCSSSRLGVQIKDSHLECSGRNASNFSCQNICLGALDEIIIRKRSYIRFSARFRPLSSPVY